MIDLSEIRAEGRHQSARADRLISDLCDEVERLRAYCHHSIGDVCSASMHLTEAQWAYREEKKKVARLEEEVEQLRRDHDELLADFKQMAELGRKIIEEKKR